MTTIKLFQAIKRMRELTEAGVHFSFTYISYSRKNKTGGDIKTIDKAMLSKGYRKDQSTLSDELIAYIDIDKDCENRQFNAHCLLSFNNLPIQL